MAELYEIIGLATNPFRAFALLMRNGGLIPFFIMALKMAWEVWKEYAIQTYLIKRDRVLLAIDVPKLSEQSMKAVEQIVGVLHGVYFSPNKKEKYWMGLVQDNFVLEIASIDGYIQYFIRCDRYNIELVKGAIFAQYPDAEVFMVEDYVNNVPQEYPNDTHEIMGGQFVLAKSDVYPIRTYEHFEHPLTGIYADPLSGLLELLSRLQPGEQVWLQMVVVPFGPEYREKCLAEADKLIGRRAPGKTSRLAKFATVPFRAIQLFMDGLANRDLTPPPEEVADEGSDGNLLSMPTGEKFVVDEIQKKATRKHFRINFRFVYIAPKGKANGWRVIGSVMGAMKQFGTLDMNSFVFSGRTLTVAPTYLFVKFRQRLRQNMLISGYRRRSTVVGDNRFILSDIEIASIYHFPLENTRAPLVSKTESKKAEAPARLPFEETAANPARAGHQRVLIQKEAPPVELPVAEEEPASIAEPPAALDGVIADAAEPSAAVSSNEPPQQPLSPRNVMERARKAVPGVVLKDSHGKVLSEINMADQPVAEVPTATTAGQGSQMNTAVSAPPQRPAQPAASPAPAPVPQQPAQAQPAPQPYPLHSMPGLPPGVRPVNRDIEVAERPAQPVPPQYQMPPQPVQHNQPVHGTIHPQAAQPSMPPQQGASPQSGNASETPPNLPI